MPAVVAVTAADFDALFRDQLQPMNPALSAMEWRRLFELPWDTGTDTIGYALKEGERFVGFAACILAVIETPVGRRRTCNVSTWVVDAEHRAAAMALVMPVLKDRELIITNLTPVPSVHEIFSRMGFKTLETAITVHPFVPSIGGGSVRFDAAIDPALLPPSIAAVHAAHRTFARTALVQQGDRQCYVIYTITRRRRLRAVRLHYVSPRGGLRWALRPLQRAVLGRHAAVLVEYDARLAADAPGPTVRVALEPSRLYRGAGVPPDAVSNAYSETVLLNI